MYPLNTVPITVYVLMQTFRYEASSEKAFFNEASCITGCLDDVRHELRRSLETVYRNSRHRDCTNLNDIRTKKNRIRLNRREYLQLHYSGGMLWGFTHYKKRRFRKPTACTYEILRLDTQIMAPQAPPVQEEPSFSQQASQPGEPQFHWGKPPYAEPPADGADERQPDDQAPPFYRPDVA